MVATARAVRSFWSRSPALSWSIVAALAAVAVVGVLVLPAAGAPVTLYPSGNNTTRSSTSWTFLGTAASALDTSDSDTSYATASTANRNLYMNIDDPGSVSGTIESVTIKVLVRNTTGNEGIQLGMSNGTNDTLNAAVLGIPNTYTEYSYTRTQDPAGGTWDWTDITNLQGAVRTQQNGSGWSGAIRVTQMWFEIVYAPSTLVTLGDGSSDPEAADVSPGQTDVVVDQFTTQRTQGVKSPTLNAVTVTRTAGAPVSAVRIVADLNSNGVVDGSDFEVGSGTFGASLTAAIDITPDQPVDDTVRSYLVIYDIGSAATGGQTTTARISAATFGNADAAPTLADDQGSTFTVVVAPTTVAIGDGPAIAGQHIQAGRVNVPVNAFTLQRTSGSKSSTVTKVTVNNSGTDPTTTVAGVHIYRDANGNSIFNEGIDVRLNTTPGQFQSPAVVTLDSLEPVDDTPDTYFVTYTFSSSALAGATSDAEVGIASSDYSNIDTLVDNDTVTTSGSFVILAEGEEPLTGGSPHAAYTTETKYCNQCHVPHEAGSEENILRFEAEGEYSQKEFCYTCHDGTSNANVKTAANIGFESGASGHALEERGEDAAPAADLTDKCTSCHYPHADSATRMRLSQETIIGKTVTGADNTWCFACHDDAQSWWVSVDSARTKAQYDALIPAPSRNTTGYPTTGTFPGETVYGTPAKNAHANIPAGSMDDWAIASREATRVAGDCLWCHSGHRGVSEYDGLVGTFGAAKDPVGADDLVDGDYANLCLRCHAETLAAGITFDSATEVPNVADSVLAAIAAPESFNGHRVRSSSGDLPVNSPLPCYMCHNPHGSTRNNSTLFSDTLGANLDTSTDLGMRAFCFTCHTTYDETAGGLPYGWDSDLGDYAPVDAADEVAGLPRAADETTKANKLRLWQIARPGHKKGDPQNCITCHLDVHAPMGSVSMGNMECLECHEPMLPMVPGNAGSTDTYHHVLNADNPDAVPGDDPYCVFPENPETQPWALSCVSCHVDHNRYESAVGASDPDKADGKAFNLRHSARSSDPVASNTDEGLCLSCHSYRLLGRIYRSTDDADPDPGMTPVPGGQANNALYATAVMRVEDDMWGYEPDPTDPSVNSVPEEDRSPHNYTADGVFDDGSAFKANCAKCHGTLDDATLSYSEPAFTVHFSAEQRLLNALGQNRSSLTPPQTAAINEEDMCFRCHSDSPDKLGESDYDYYGGRLMGVASRAIAEQMDPAHSEFGHKPASYYMEHRISSIDEPQEYISANKHVECADCHNHHVVGKARHVYGTTNLVSDALKGVRGVGFGVDADAVRATLGDTDGSGPDIGLVSQNYPSTIDYGAPNSELVYKQMATYEYEVCFKCHSSANTSLAGWGGLMSWTVWPGGTENSPKPNVNNWTNVAQDFNVGNNSRHPVFATLDGRYYESQADYEYDLASDFAEDSKVPITGYTSDPYDARTSKLADAGQVTNGWSQGDTMMCSDCHGDSNAPIAMVEKPVGSGNWETNSLAEEVPQGPHGASVRFSLRGPHTSWPTWGPAAAPYGYEGQLITLSTMAALQAGSPVSLESGGVFCTNCHPAAKVRDNIVHRKGAHSTYPCIRCHILVPHGGKVSRLIGDAQGMPSRLAYQGDLSNMWVSGFRKRQDPGDYVLADCAVSTNNSGCSGGANKHTANNNPTGVDMENW